MSHGKLICLAGCITFCSAVSADTSGLLVSAESAIIIEAERGKVLWEKNADVKRFPASTTKILTTLLLLEHCSPVVSIKAPTDVENVEPSSMHLKPGEIVSAHDMSYALMHRSANDGCYAVAMHIAGSVPAFAKLMNQRAKQIGCTNTDFRNASGLPNPNHKTTARDLALIAREAMKLPDFRAIVKAQGYTLTRSINQEDLVMKNKNKWLSMDPTADGIKTGWTRAAGQCYVGSATRDGYRLITVVLKSKDWVADHKSMLHWAYKFHERRLIAHSGQEIAQVPVIGSQHASIPAAARDDLYSIVRKNRNQAATYVVEGRAPATAPIRTGDSLGMATIAFSNGDRIKVSLVALSDAPKQQNSGGRDLIPPTAGTVSLALVLGGGAIWMRNRSRSIAADLEQKPSKYP